VDEQLSRGLGNVQVVLKELLDGEKGFLIERLDRALLEHLAQEHLAQGGGQLVDKTGDAEVLIADDGLFGIEHLADLKSHLSLLEGAGEIVDADNGGAYAHHTVSVELAGKGVDNGTGKLLEVLGLYAGANFLDKGDVVLADVDDKVLGLVREKVLDNVEGGNVGAGGDADEEAGAADVGGKAKLPCLEVNIAGKDIVKYDVLYEVAAVVLFVVILLDSAERNRKNGYVP